jgi:hypothetical protein
MRVERGQHPVDRALDQSVIVDLIDIIGLHSLVDAHELLKLVVIGDVGRRERAGRHRDESERRNERKRWKQLVNHVHE